MQVAGGEKNQPKEVKKGGNLLKGGGKKGKMAEKGKNTPRSKNGDIPGEKKKCGQRVLEYNEAVGSWESNEKKGRSGKGRAISV